MFSILEPGNHLLHLVKTSISLQQLTLETDEILMAFLKSQEKRKINTIIYLIYVV